MMDPPIQTETQPQQAVCVRGACKNFGSKKNPIVVLDGLNMTVPKGAIYGLLGASGCGKTTLLNCLIGRKSLDSGDIWVLGSRPGSKGSGIPGSRIGYMPQDILLYGEFTIRETLKYFGWIANMTTEQIETRLEILLKILALPDADSFVGTFSGGQQRRVSLAIALLHEPELLILDEPTVGVDPLLRQSIWEHLIEISNTHQTTIIITTHYIDEAKEAHLIALMRGGYFLAEQSPQRVIEQFACENLEEAFLKLSLLQNKKKKRNGSISQEVTQLPAGAVNAAAVFNDEISEISGEFGDIAVPNAERTFSERVEMPPIEEKDWRKSKIMDTTNISVMMWKNIIWMKRNLLIMMFILGLPVLQVFLFFLSIGHEPIELPISVVNYELEETEICQFKPGCNSTRLSCNYLEFVPKTTLQLNFYSSEEEGKNSVRRGDTWATVVFHSNFSESLKARIIGKRDMMSWDLITSTIAVYQDNSNQNLATYVTRDLFQAFESFIQDYMKSCNWKPQAAVIPIRWENPVYGSKIIDFADFSAPGIILTLIFFLAMTLTVGAIMIERSEGILERSLSSGVSHIEILFAHLISDSVVMLGQCGMVFFVTFVIFSTNQKGSLLLVLILGVLTGLCGMCFGVTVSCLCADERTATFVGLGSFLPIINLGGVIWPLEGMQEVLRIFAYILPLTQSTESLRCIMSRGWGFSNPEVYEGFIATLLWSAIFLFISVLLLKFRKN